MPWFRRRTPPRHPKILCYLNHFYGRSSSEVEYGSAVTSRTVRRDIVERTVTALRALPFDVDLQICGFREQALVPVDIDLSSIGEPQHIVYESLERMLDAVARYDYFLNLEDDILIDARTLERMMAFEAAASVNEVLLPNRVETNSTKATYCVDLLAAPGWKGLSHQFDGLALDVANNPHSGLLFLSRRQLQYARDRVQWSRRERFTGGFMASAYANAHLPFLLWRSKRNVDGHCVVHLDRWAYSDALLAAQADNNASPPGASAQEATAAPVGHVPTAQAHIDSVHRDGMLVVVNGWAALSNGGAAKSIELALGDVARTDAFKGLSFQSIERPDVSAAVPGVDGDCGFSFVFPLVWLATEDGSGDDLQVLPTLRMLDEAGASDPAADSMATAGLRDKLGPVLSQVPRIPALPHMPEAAVAHLEAAMRSANCYLEFGTGGTTVTAHRLGVPQIIGVESDELWLEMLRRKLTRSHDGRLHLLHIDIGPTGEWGYPLSDSAWKQFRNYPLVPWEYCIDHHLSPDLVLIDGRFRRACFLATCLLAKPGTRVLFDDYLDRPHYHDVEDFFQRVATVERVAEFVVPAEISRDAVWIRLTQALSDAS